MTDSMGTPKRASRPGRPPAWAVPAVVAAAGLALVLVGVAIVAFVLAGSDDQPPATGQRPTATSAAPGEPARTVGYRLEPERGRAVSVRLEVAADPVTRARGLMGRRELPAGAGMVFLYRDDVEEAFWMKDTLVPLSIAFVAADGRVVSVAEMTPCRADPCPSYPPAGPYRYAVELAAGAFGAAGVGPGAKVIPEDPAALPEAV